MKMAQQKLRAKALLIDLDGTIVESSEAFEEAAKTAFSAVEHKQISENTGVELTRLLQRNLSLNDFFEKNHVDETLRAKFLAEFLQSFYNIAPDKTKLLPSVDKTLRVLSKDFRLALITRRNVPETVIRKELKRLHVDSYFMTIVTAYEVREPTPSPDAIIRAAEELLVPVQSCIVISDSGVDIQAGKSAGTRTVAVLSGLFSEEELRKENPDLIVENIDHLLEHLQLA